MQTYLQNIVFKNRQCLDFSKSKT